MKRVNRYIRLFILPILVISLIMTAISCGNADEYGSDNTDKGEDQMENVSESVLQIQKVENIPADFIMGMDASCVPSLEASGVKYYDRDGVEKDVYEILSDNGINYIRVRIWNDPFDADGNGYGGGNCDIENAVKVGERATKYGMKLLVNFHYSDFWADPAKQMIPKAWKGFTVDEKAGAIYEYTKDCLIRLKDAGVDIGMVQVGNETNGVLCGESAEDEGGWERITQLMSAGSKAVREVCPEALVVIHVSNPEKVGTYEEYGRQLHINNVDYDVFASSYYPFWHGTLDNLANLLNHISDTYGKQVMVAETSYAYTPDDSDYFANTIGSGFGCVDGYPFTQQGQAKHVRDIIDMVVNKAKCGIGVFYWEGTWVSVGGSSYEENLELWQQHGSGWATSYAGEYDPKDAGQWFGGCAVENQALFDEKGRALESLKIFELVKTGTEN